MLQQYIRSVYIDWSLYGNSFSEIQRAFLLVLKYCTSLRRLFVREFPPGISRNRYPKYLNVTAFGTKYSSNTVNTILGTFKDLRELCIYVNGSFNGSLFSQTPHHALKKLRLNCDETCRTLFFDAVEACSDSVEELHISVLPTARSVHGSRPTISSLAGMNLRIIRLDNFALFAIPFSPATRLLKGLTRLEELHLTRCLRLPGEAFTLFPLTLRLVHLSGKRCYSNRELAAIFEDLRVGFRQCPLPIRRLEIQKFPKTPPKYLMSSFNLLKDTCDTEAITFQMSGSGRPGIRIIC
jgi:hypothetical protein